MGATRVGKTLGNFRILECLGSGGAGMIWKAEDVSLGRIVALKALRPELAADGEMAERFRVEARTLARLAHPNIASLHSLIEDEDGLFLVLEYVEGSTLSALLATSGPLPFESAFALFHQALDGVGHAHEAGVVHRDLKPANLMVDARGRVKVMDFGIARIAGAARTTHHGKLVGTPEYMSPEQVRGEDATIRSDIYSLGIVLYEMLTGRTPFRATSTFDLMRAQLEDAPEDPQALRPDLDARIAKALLRALAKQPALRFGSTRELHDCLVDAGASGRARAITPAWNALAPAAARSEAPTLRMREPTLARHGDGEAPLSALPRRSGALATLVIDATEETAQLEPTPLTRMLADAPFAAHARAIGNEPGAATRTAGLLLAGGLLAALALALGAVRLTSRAEEAAPPPALARLPVSAPQPVTPAQDAGRSSATEAPPERAREPQRERPKALRAAKPAQPKPAAQEESGWVIRR